MTTCVSCSCTDDNACVNAAGEACAWAMKWMDGTGLCTFCAEESGSNGFETFLDALPVEQVLAPPAPRLILPGDPEFHL
jgi:hypothetical protein